MSRRRCVAALVAGVVMASQVVAARADDDEDRAARAAIARGDAQPVQALLQRVRSEFAGSVLKIELEHEDEGEAPWIYEVKLLGPQGDILELEYDAATLELIELEGRYREGEEEEDD